MFIVFFKKFQKLLLSGFEENKYIILFLKLTIHYLFFIRSIIMKEDYTLSPSFLSILSLNIHKKRMPPQDSTC